MPTSPHRIRRQCWVVRAGSTASAFNIRKCLRDDWRVLLLPAFEKAFDESVNGGAIIRIPKIELRLKVLSEERMTECLPELIYQKLGEQLRELLQDRPRRIGTPAAWKRSTIPQTRLETLLHYLRTGSVNWAAAGSSVSELASELPATCREQWAELPALLRNEPTVAAFYFRLFQLISAAESGSLARALVEGISPSWQTPFREMLGWLLESGQRFFGRHSQLELAALFVAEALARPASPTPPDFALLAERVLPPPSGQSLNDFIASLPVSAAGLLRRVRSLPAFPAAGTPAASAADAEEVAEELRGSTEKSVWLGPPALPDAVKDLSAADAEEVVEELRASTEKSVWLGPSALPDAVQDLSAADTEGLVEELRASTGNSVWLGPSALPYAVQEGESSSLANQAPTISSTRGAADEFPLMVTHAGLILLHPFLPRFLENTGAKGNADAQLSPFVLARAAALLHFLATGLEEIYEYDLGFIKVLLGVDPDAPLCVADGLIADNDQPEAEALLQAAISHWAALKNTSVAGFRSSFLQRQALLRDEESGWKIQVERTAFDVLLDQLPWSISVVKLPWMPRPIYTEW